MSSIFVCYSDQHAAGTYRMYNIETGKVIVTRDVQWLDKKYGAWKREDMFQIPGAEEDEDSEQNEDPRNGIVSESGREKEESQT